MKVKYLFLSMLACGLLAACNDDENVALDGNDENAFIEGESYMAIRLVASNDATTRATEGDPAYEAGVGDENNVASAEFYFYNDNGGFVTDGEVSATWNSNGSTNDNVESISDVIVVLENVTETPTKVLAILNGTNVVGDLQGMSLDEAVKKIIEDYSYTADGSSYFVMSNSAYVTEDNEVQQATPISNINLCSTEELAKENPVEIYVERVAAKVSLTKSETFSATIGTDSDPQVDGESAELNITVTGWGLSGTNKTAYGVKNIQTTTYWTGWNSYSNYRSYWAEDPNYSNGTYPENYDGWVDDNNGEYCSLSYLTYNDLTKSYSEADYCLENTMNEDVLKYDSETESIQTSAVTHVLIAATLTVGDEEAQTLYRYIGKFYTEENYKAITLSDWAAAGNMIYTRSTNTEGDYVYTPIATTDIEIEDKHEGKVNISLSDAAMGETWYTVVGYDAETGQAESSEVVASESLSTIFDSLNDADGFKEGKMYYCVPIEHLNATMGEVGSYGVVRNHSYKLTLQSITNLGTAVYDPNEVIIPNDNASTYYVAATLNILSWHVVSQNVNL